MDKYFDGIKDNLNIVQALESSDTDEESSSAVKKLRPKNQHKVKEIVQEEDEKRQAQIYHNRNYSPIIIDKTQQQA